jgi:very-short-patch-repair endonuclease
MTKCATCGKEHNNKMFCSRKCAGKSYERQVEKPCKICGKIFTSAPSQERIYCSRECWAQSRQGVAMTPQTRVYLNCEMCGKQFWKWPSAVANGEGRCCSYECLNEWKRTIKGATHPLYKPPAKLICEWCGERYETKPSIAPRSHFCSRQCQGAWTAQHQSAKRTRIEVIVEDWLRESKITYEAQAQMGRFVCDFVLRRAGLVIECDGSYWHSIPLVKSRDKRKDEWLKANGYRILRLREDDIHNRPEWCKEQLASHL